jgi:hypothetical protein
LEFDLRATVRRTYRLPGKRLLLLEDSYEGGVETGDWIQIGLPDGRQLRARIDGVAWGSAYSAENPPLTLICLWNDDPDPPPGSTVRSEPRH